MTTGELIRILSHYCPDTDISVIHVGREHNIHVLLDADAISFDVDAEVCIAVR